MERSIAPGETHSYPLDLAGGQLMRVLFVHQLPFPLTVTLAAPDGKIIAERGSRTNIAFSAPAANSGRYTLQVSAGKDKAGAGRYSARYVEIRSQAAGDDALLQADATYSELSRGAATSSQDAANRLDAVAALYAGRRQPEFQAWTLLLAGQYWTKLSEFKNVAARYADAAVAFETAGDRESQARALDGLANTWSVLRDYPKAIDAAAKALVLAREKHLPAIEAGALSTLGRAYSQMGENQRGLDYLQQALALTHTLGDPVREATALTSAANLYRSLRSFDKAFELYRDALAIHRRLGDKLAEAGTLNGIGGTYGYMGQPAKALENFQQAIAILRTAEGGRLALATTLSNSGQAMLELHQTTKAVAALEEALSIFRANGSRWDQVYTTATLGRAKHALNDLEGAAETLHESLGMKEENDDPSVEACTRLDLARLERTRGNQEEALAQITAAIDVFESVRNRILAPDLRGSLMASVSEYYELQVDTLMQLYRQGGSPARLEEAREAAERRRARNLIDVLAAAKVQALPADPALTSEERKLRLGLRELSGKRTNLLRAKSPAAEVATVDKRIDTVWTEYQGVRGKLMAADPMAASLEDPVALHVDALRRDALDADTLLLEYSLGKERSFLWCVSMDGLRGYDLPKRAQIEEAASAFWEAVKGGLDAAAVERAGSRLSQMVLGPAAGLLANKRLLIVADGALQYVPFAALADPAQPRAYRPLMMAHEIVSEPSAGTLALLRRVEKSRQPAPRTLAVFADPVFEASDPRLRKPASLAAMNPKPAFLTRAAELGLARLPASRQEGRSIASILPESQRWLALDFEANRDAATSGRLADYRILHFATHGILESARPELSALALSLYDAQGKPQDGFLRLYEIYNLKIRADLVVLSACQTALGKNLRGEGLIGLARGFMQAGAPRVAASLWKVDDQATAVLMRHFYEGMLGPQHKPAAAALRDAQIAVARDERWRSPYYWAAFTLQGEWK